MLAVGSHVYERLLGSSNITVTNLTKIYINISLVSKTYLQPDQDLYDRRGWCSYSWPFLSTGVARISFFVAALKSWILTPVSVIHGIINFYYSCHSLWGCWDSTLQMPPLSYFFTESNLFVHVLITFFTSESDWLDILPRHNWGSSPFSISGSIRPLLLKKTHK